MSASGGVPGTETARPRLFKIRGADSHGQRSSANILIKRRYAWRGYQNAGLPDQQTPNRITLTATDHDAIIGTITVGLDSPEGLHAEDTFAEEIATLRRAGRRICEFTKLAMDPVSGAKQVLASLFHVAYIVAYRFKGFDTLLIEVNPRHVGYYTRMLGCTVLGQERLNRRVNAPAVLLHLDFSYTLQQIGRFGGKPELASSERSLYPYSFSLSEEAGIISRLQKSNWSTERPAI
ncbi:long-chain N-acyl amino acid synthase [Aquincola sp. MAHUQ-54]|uniref:Long-chain N-acyl amino acid synthase n=1 Tax=Aquincola agrisoli TaxID=3119538 RepID=A0AAW9QSJ3_9BURK